MQQATAVSSWTHLLFINFHVADRTGLCYKIDWPRFLMEWIEEGKYHRDNMKFARRWYLSKIAFHIIALCAPRLIVCKLHADETLHNYNWF